MGLDITAFSKLQVLTPEEVKAAERSVGVQIDLGESVYHFTQRDINSPDNWIRDMVPGTYYQSPKTEEYDFKAGSYSGYSAYRRMLSECFLGALPEEVWSNQSIYRGQPFYEQVNFSDCEGFIGPEFSAKLAEDYEEGRDQWYEYLKESGEGANWVELHMARYDNWTKAFKVASDGGFVWFH
jgi:hypothetical protein